MYHITTNTGLDETFNDPTDIGGILLSHLAEHAPHGRIEWRIETGDVPVWGSLNTHGQPVTINQLRADARDIATSLLWIHHKDAWQTSPTRIGA